VSGEFNIPQIDQFGGLAATPINPLKEELNNV